MGQSRHRIQNNYIAYSFAPNIFYFTTTGMVCRVNISDLHYNEQAAPKQQLNKSPFFSIYICSCVFVFLKGFIIVLFHQDHCHY